MGRPYPNRRRRRPGRRPPNRYSGLRDYSSGFTPTGLDTFYRAFMPGLRGREKRDFFNDISAWLIMSIALGGAVVGFAWLGPIGAFLGMGAGLMAGGAITEKGGFYRR
jgi:hypothetical protein